MMSRYQGNPGESHWTEVKNIIKYLRSTKDMFLVYGGKEELRIKGYVDASFQIDIDNFRSQCDFVFMLNEGAMTWRSSKQATILESSTELEYIVANEVAKEAMWVNNFINDVGVFPSIFEPIEIFCDNEGETALAKESQDHKCTKHILRKFHYIRKLFEYGCIILSRVSSEDNLYYLLTKRLSQIKHNARTISIDIRFASELA